MADPPRKVTLTTNDNENILIFEFDATVSHDYTASVDLTRQPIENGSVIVDHIIVQPRTVTFDVWQTNMRQDTLTERETLLLSPNTQSTPAANLYADLLIAQTQGRTFVIDTPLLNNNAARAVDQALLVSNLYVITEIGVEKNSKTGQAVHMRRLTLEQIRTVRNKTSKLPKTRKTTGAAKKSTGQVQCIPATAAETVKAKEVEVNGTFFYDANQSVGNPS